MCGIIGFISEQQNVVPGIVDGLKSLEYRGYDSAGIAWFERDGFRVVKAKGRIGVLEGKLAKIKNLSSLCGIGHTRWATHGEPKDANSHPLQGGIRFDNFAIVHNGIIENFQEIHAFLRSKRYRFRSETDTENVAHLIDYHFRQDPKAPIQDVVRKALRELKGSFALAIVQKDHPDRIVAVKRDSPLVIGLGKGFNYLASDVGAFVARTKDYVLLDDDEIAIVEAGKTTVYDSAGRIVPKPVNKISWDASKIQKSGFKHYMLKEIHEEPKVVENLLRIYAKNKTVSFGFARKTVERLKKISSLSIVACGSALYAGMIGQNLIESVARIKTAAHVASEFRYQRPILGESDVCVLISQSGETADTIAALREAKARGALTVAIVNVVASTIAREADVVLYTQAGPEIAVATTKAYLAQVCMMALFALHLGVLRKTTTAKAVARTLTQFAKLPKLIEKMLADKRQIQKIASKYHAQKNVFFIGRGLDYVTCLEGSLKLKEISYIHSEAYPAGELKHGTISLIEDRVLVIALATQPHVYDKLVSNAIEVAARGAATLLITNKKADKDKIKFKDMILVPATDPLLAPVLNAIALQLLAYYVAAERGCDIDKPRNLAKSVTVE